MSNTAPEPRHSASLANGGSAHRGPDTQEEVSLLRLVNFVLRYRLLLMAVPLLAALAVVGFTLAQGRTYTSTASFTPQSSEQGSAAFSGIAAQLGIALPRGRGGASPAFYADLLESREILADAVETEYTAVIDGAARRGTLGALLEIEATTEAARHEKAIEKLKRATKVSTGRETGIVRFSVEAPAPELAEQIAARMLALINEFNLERRLSQASAERKFIEERVNTARGELGVAEDRLKRFLDRNRQFRNSPELSFEFERLQREVGMRQQVYTSLVQAYEQARIEEVRDIPVITVLEAPAAPVRPNGRGTIGRGLLALLVGGAAALFLSLVLEVTRRNRQEARPEFQEFIVLRAEALADLRRPWRALSSRPGADVIRSSRSP